MAFAHPAPGTDPRVDVDVLVVGAGPVGLAAAIEAVRHGLTVRIIDRKLSRSTFSKALVVHARTLEVFETMGVVDQILAEGTRFAALNIRAGARGDAVRIDLLDLPWGDTAYPFWLSIPQYTTEQVLERHLNKLGSEVEWGVTLTDLRDSGDHVAATLYDGEGTAQVVRSRWLIGADGSRSRVRELAGLQLKRIDARATFILADVKTTAELVEDEGYGYLHPDGLLLIVPMPEPRLWRIIAHVRRPPKDAPINIDAAYLDDLIRRRSGLEFGSHDVAWQSQFNLRHGLVDRYRRGRIFLAGDAAHVHSPVGGQGLNTGVQDAHNLVWKLAAARHFDDAAAERLLDSYEAERRSTGQAMVRGTARVTRLLTARNRLGRTLLGSAAPRVLARAGVRARLGRPVGMLELTYRDSALVAATAASSLVGRRAPNPELPTGGRLHDRLDDVAPTWVIRGQSNAGAFSGSGSSAATGEDRWAGLPTVFLADDDWAAVVPPGTDVNQRVLLVRPDRYVAAIGQTAEAAHATLEVPIRLDR